MRLHKITNIIITIILVISFVLVLFPSKTYAAEDDNENYIEIRTVEDLYNIRNNLSGNYKLMNDIDLTEATAEGGKFDDQGRGWRPIGKNLNSWNDDYFTGVFDGQGYTIKGMRMITNTVEGGYGLFSVNSGIIKNIVLSDFNITAAASGHLSYVGSVSGSNNGTIDNISVVGCYFEINKYYRVIVAGVVGENASIIKHCFCESEFYYNKESYYDNNYAYISGITNSITTGVGQVDSCVSKNKFNSRTGNKYGHISGIMYLKNNSNGTLVNSYSISEGYDSPLGNAVKAFNCYYVINDGLVLYDSNGNKSTLNQNQMCYQMFYEGFDFDNTWIIDNQLAYKCPILRDTYNGDIKNELLPELTIDGWTYGSQSNSPVLTNNFGDGAVNYEYKQQEADDNTYNETVPIDAGEYTLRATIDETDYYKGAVITTDFIIEPKEISLYGVEAIDKEYDGSTNAELDCSSVWFSGLLEDDYIDVEGTGVFENKNVGKNKKVTINNLQLKGLKAKNYTVKPSSIQQDLQADITEKSINVDAEDTSKTYGEIDPEFTYSVKGLVDGEEVDTVVSGRLAREEGEDAGTYTINQGSLTFGDNYLVNYKAAEFTINQSEGDQTKPDPPELLSRTETSIIVKVVDGYEYRIGTDQSEWNTSGVFNNLKPDTVYNIFTRKAGTINVKPGKVSDALSVRTVKHNHEYIESSSVEPTCTKKGEKKYTCSCGDSYTITIPSLGHDWDEGVVTKEPTCSNTGLKSFECKRDDCDETKFEVISKTAHQEEIIPAIAATCTKEGSSEGKKCTVCSEIIEKPEVIPALGHKEKNPVKENEIKPTCTDKGSYDSVVYCSVCGTELSRKKEYSEPTGHTIIIDSAKSATCTENGLTEGSHCSVCNEIIVEQNIISAYGHKWSEGIITTYPSCSKKGIRTFICSRCGDKKTEEIDTLDHTIVIDNGKPASCTENGLTNGAHCSECGTVFIEQEEIPKNGHKFGDWIQNDDDENLIYRICSVCGDREDSEHMWDEGTVTTAPTCTTDGVKTYKCADCDAIKTETITANGHDPVVDKGYDPTCTEPGLSSGIHCSVCDEVIEAQTEISPLGHIWKEEVIKEATYTEEGELKRSCENCGIEETDTIETITIDDSEYDLFEATINGKKGWYKSTNGKYDPTYTGFGKNAEGTWYVVKGAVSTSTSGPVSGTVDGLKAWYYVKNGKIDYSYKGFYKVGNSWMYFSKGKVDKTINADHYGSFYGVINGEGAWYVVKAGKAYPDFKGFALVGSSWMYYKNGKVNKTVNGIITGTVNGTSAKWYVKSGKVQLSYSGTYKKNGKTYTIKKGKVTSVK